MEEQRNFRQDLHIGDFCCRASRHLRRLAFALAIAFTLTVLSPESMHAQFSVIHYFSGGSDGGNPEAGVTIGGSGLLYGTAGSGGTSDSGAVFSLKRRGSGWILNPLFEFPGTGSLGGGPIAGLAIGAGGALYGTTHLTNGAVFELRPSVTACKSSICYWNGSILHGFTGDPDGAGPGFGSVIFDQAGDIYGTTAFGGTSNCGTVYELAQMGGEHILYNFTGGSDGCFPFSGVIFDSAGNLYGTTGGDNEGATTVYQLMPSNGGWVLNTLVDLGSQFGGEDAYGTLIMDGAGNLFGTTLISSSGQGAVYELSPSNGNWSLSLVYNFPHCYPAAGVTLGPDGNLYGVCSAGGAFGDGWVFQMPPSCNQTCTPNDLHDFDGSDGAEPQGAVVFDASGNLYGTTSQGGNTGPNCVNSDSTCGVVWEIAGVGARHDSQPNSD